MPRKGRGIELIDQLAASIVGETVGGSLSRKVYCKEHLFFQIISGTTQVATRAGSTDTSYSPARPPEGCFP